MTMRPLRRPERKSLIGEGLGKPTPRPSLGGNARIALSLKAARVTTAAGRMHEARNGQHGRVCRQSPTCAGNVDRGISMRTEFVERPSYDPQEAEDREAEREPSHRKTGREGKIEARETELIDEI